MWLMNLWSITINHKLIYSLRFAVLQYIITGNFSYLNEHHRYIFFNRVCIENCQQCECIINLYKSKFPLTDYKSFTQRFSYIMKLITVLYTCIRSAVSDVWRIATGVAVLLYLLFFVKSI